MYNKHHPALVFSCNAIGALPFDTIALGNNPTDSNDSLLNKKIFNENNISFLIFSLSSQVFQGSEELVLSINPPSSQIPWDFEVDETQGKNLSFLLIYSMKSFGFCCFMMFMVNAWWVWWIIEDLRIMRIRVTRVLPIFRNSNSFRGFWFDRIIWLFNFLMVIWGLVS